MDLIQFLNKIIFKNRKILFEKKNYKEKNSTEFFENNFEEDENIPFNISIKDYLLKKCENNQFSLKLFKRNILGLKIIGKLNVLFFKINTGKINFELFSKIFENEKKIISYNYIESTGIIKNLIINKLGGLWEQYNSFINTLNDYFPKEALEKIISIIFHILQKFNTETLFKKPMKFVSNVLIEYKGDILDNSKNILTKIISFINENFIQLKDFIVPFWKNIIDVMLNNIEFIKNFKLGDFKEYLTSAKNEIYDKISEAYEGVKKSENTKKIIENAKYSTDKIVEVSEKIINKGINKIKDISKSETINNIKSSCEEATNYIGNKLKGFFS